VKDESEKTKKKKRKKKHKKNNNKERISRNDGSKSVPIVLKKRDRNHTLLKQELEAC
jgi:hypothetical protein